MTKNSNEDYFQQRDDYDNSANVISHLEKWKDELEDKVSANKYDTLSHGLISEIELAIARLELLAGSEVRRKSTKLMRLKETPDDYDYRIMCEWGYNDRADWKDAEDNGVKIEAGAGDYIIIL